MLLVTINRWFGQQKNDQTIKYVNIWMSRGFNNVHVTLARDAAAVAVCQQYKLSLVSSFKVHYYNNIIVDWAHTIQVRSLMGK